MFRKRLLQAIVGLLGAVILLEMVFYVRDKGAFPHVNVYIDDEDMGIRLRPHAAQRLQLKNNPISTIEINDQGYRGPNFPNPSDDEILVVGDSQVFGVGVEHEETFSSRLEQLLGRTVINAGVPTYGPIEYTAIAEELIVERRPKTLVYTLNFANDLFELNEPNAQRHSEWEGRAVRREVPPEQTRDFLGRAWLFQHSHAFFALRGLLPSTSLELGQDLSSLSMGSWENIVAQGKERRLVETTNKEDRLNTQTELKQIATQREAVNTKIDRQLLKVAFKEAEEEEDVDNRLLLKAASARLGDIVSEQYLETSREVAVTAAAIRRGARYRNQLIASLRERGDLQWDVLEPRLAELSALDAKEQQLTKQLLKKTIPSVLSNEVIRVKEICDKHNVELILLVLPIDVQVSPTEWEKYGVKSMDMSETIALLDDVLRDANQMGIRTAHPLEALRAVQPGAFLDGDLHLSPIGHDGVAMVLKEAIEGPAPMLLPAVGLPTGRTRIPRQEEWLTTSENVVSGAAAVQCETVQIREWLRVTCLRTPHLVPTAVEILTGDHSEGMTIVTEESTSLVTPLFVGEEFRADFYWKHHKQTLVVQWNDTESVMSFTEREQPGRAQLLSEAQERVCACYKQVAREKFCTQADERIPGNPTAVCEPSCRQMFGGNVDSCSAEYADDCQRIVDCVQGRLSSVLTCPQGMVNAGGNGVCVPLCNEENPCAQGACNPWMGTGVCW